uniref:Somatoliberin n=1 Tax=Bos taurus TaxID=9913 RepID=A0AAF6YXR9_BOVIN
MLLWVFFLVTLTLSSGSHGSLPSQPLRIPRYADAIFTNSYRKVLGQLSARKLLQDIMNRQQGERNQEQGAKVRLGRQVDGVWTDQQQMALESTLVSLLQERRWEYSQGTLMLLV